MTIEVSCKVCGRKIVNLATSHLCEDGSYVGPICKDKMDSIPTMESLILSKEETSRIHRKMSMSTYKLKLEGKEADVHDEKMWKEMRNIPWDPFMSSVFKAPAHPNAISSINLNELVAFKKILKKGEREPEFGFEPITEDHIARAAHCFLKLFKDPNLNKEQMELFHKRLGIKLLGVAPSARHEEKISDFSNFVITSTKSPFPERALMINVSAAGWVNFRCLHLINGGVESSWVSNALLCVPSTLRRNDGCSDFKNISAMVVSIFMLDDPSTESEVFPKFFNNWRNFNNINVENAFEFIVPDADNDEE